ncbi:MAG: hypothetical protein IPM47_10665 [Sphingobacteriales bacterium]|nr:MAG: hypothetical protein IPM47_10665 [Sphingobacteriales bacterium]
MKTQLAFLFKLLSSGFCKTLNLFSSVIWLAFFFFWTLSSVNGQDVSDIKDEFAEFKVSDSLVGIKHQLFSLEANQLIKYLKALEQREKRFNGNARFGFAGDKTDIASLYKINGGISVYRGYYPDKFEFTNDVGIVISNGVFTENVSNIFMTYDHTLMVGDSLFLEDYAVMSRFSDEFLGIEQRYELGGGIILAHWSKKLTKNGKDELRQISKLRITPPQKGTDSLTMCVDGDCLRFKRNNSASNEESQIHQSQQLAKVAVRKKYNKFRAALLAGLIFETEKGFAADTISTAFGTQYFYHSFNASQFLRWEIRPTLDLKPNDYFTLKIRPFFKMPMPWEWYSEESKNGIVSKAVDYRIDLQTNLNIKLSEKMNKQASFELQFRILYDNAPRRTFLDIPDGEGNPVFLSAQKIHQLVRLMFQVGF